LICAPFRQIRIFILQALDQELAVVQLTAQGSTKLTAQEVVQLGQARSWGADLMKQVECITSFNFQQALNCCQLTTIAYGLSALGFPTSVDDLFWTVGINADSAVGDGMTLAETHEAALWYIRRTGLPLGVACYHFDAHTASHADFLAICKIDSLLATFDVFALNFNSAIAHGMPMGGGHFSILCAYDEKLDAVIVADVHPMKYGAFWSTPSKNMFDAMVDYDSVGRARGLLRFHLLEAPPLAGHHIVKSVVDWTNPPKPYSGLGSYIPCRWDEYIGVKNLAGVCALSLGLGVLCGFGRDYHLAGTSVDTIMSALRESYTWHLNNFMLPERLCDLANRCAEKGLASVRATLVTLKGLRDGTALKEALHSVGCGTAGVVVLAAYDVNVARGTPLHKVAGGEAGALTHGLKTWSLLASFDVDALPSADSGLAVAPAHDLIVTGRIWLTALDRMAQGMAELDVKELVVLNTKQRDQ
jgi:hypothetical protein